jgi:hypothetical protein
MENGQSSQESEEREITIGDEARYCLFFCAENETFAPFKEWAIQNAVTVKGKEWAEQLTVNGLRESGIALHIRHSHQMSSDSW